MQKRKMKRVKGYKKVYEWKQYGILEDGTIGVATPTNKLKVFTFSPRMEAE